MLLAETNAREALRLRDEAVLAVRPFARFIIGATEYVEPPTRPKWIRVGLDSFGVPSMFRITSADYNPCITAIYKHLERNTPPLFLIAYDYTTQSTPEVGFYGNTGGEYQLVEPESPIVTRVLNELQVAVSSN